MEKQFCTSYPGYAHVSFYAQVSLGKSTCRVPCDVPFLPVTQMLYFINCSIVQFHDSMFENGV